MKELFIIVKVTPYVGNNTWLDCGGDHLRQTVKGMLIDDLLEGKKVMYAIIHINKNGGAYSDWGYATIKEAKQTIPKGKQVIICE